MKEKVEVSIICNTYNQVDYIETAIDSFLKQHTDFKYEIIVHDDASTDGTTEILKHYEYEYPNHISVIYEKENKHSRGISVWMDIIEKHVKGKYIALCEGDDFWIDDNKLQLQYEALEEHKECDMCACWGCTVTEDGLREISQIRPHKESGILDIKEVILGGGQYLATAGLFSRREMYFDMLGMGFLDYAQQIRGALKSGIYYIDRKMVAYRRYSKGSWTNRVLKNDNELKKQWKKDIKLLETFDNSTSGKYHEIILQRLKAYTPFTQQLAEREEDILKDIDGYERPCFIWGYGRRGKNLEAYLDSIGIVVDGVCDAINENIGSKTEYNNVISSTEYVLQHAVTIFASTRYAYDDLIMDKFQGKLVDFQQFMPYG